MTRPLLVTLDTNQLDAARVEALHSAIAIPVQFACVTVSERERGEGFTADLNVIPETMVWGESPWNTGTWSGPIPELMVLDESRLDQAVLGDDGTIDVFETALFIISNGSFPARENRDGLTPGQVRQLRDAMIFEAHIRHRRDVFVTLDARGFVKDGRRAQLETLGGTRILTADELVQMSEADQLRLVREP